MMTGGSNSEYLRNTLINALASPRVPQGYLHALLILKVEVVLLVKPMHSSIPISSISKFYSSTSQSSLSPSTATMLPSKSSSSTTTTYSTFTSSFSIFTKSSLTTGIPLFNHHHLPDFDILQLDMHRPRDITTSSVFPNSLLRKTKAMLRVMNECSVACIT